MKNLLKFAFYLVIFCPYILRAQKPFVFGKSNEHARAICNKGKTIFIGTNLGKIYKVKGNKSNLISTDSFPEIRDIQLVRKKLHVMQTGNIGRMICFKKGLFGKYKLDRIQTFESSGQNVFLDGFSISKKKGLLMGDPVEGMFSLYSLSTSGMWEKLPNVASNTGEAAFAASGTTVHVSANDWYFVSGGLDSRLFHSSDYGLSWDIQELPFSSCESCGAYSLCVLTKSNLVTKVIVGGDYLFPNEQQSNSFLQINADSTWITPEVSPRGYRSVVIYNEKSNLLFCGGTNGVDFSSDFGRNWHSISKEKCFSMIPYKKGIIYTSELGRIIRLKDVNK
jgi:hypothetical protein